jgi:hypothetical protein
MTSKSTAAGLALLLDLGVSCIINSAPQVTSTELDELRTALSQFLDSSITAAECRAHFLRIIQHDTPLSYVQDILNLPPEPLVFRGDNVPDDRQILSGRKRTRSWSNDEDQRLLGGIVRYGLDNWPAVAKFVGAGRNRAQCSQRWSRGLNPRISKRGWTPEEEQHLVALVAQYGRQNWAKIASILGNRSDVQCRYHFGQVESRHADDSNIELVRQSPFTRSTDFLLPRQPAPPNPPPAFPAAPSAQTVAPPVEARLTLEQGKTFMSTPNFGTRPRLAEGKGKGSEKQGDGWGVTGADPHSLQLFLGNFQ